MAEHTSIEDDLPLLCDTCLGPSEMVRMTKIPNGKACKICERPFTVYRWQPGPNARFKKTELCKTCAKAKNVCQTCILDLTYNLPVQVRDQLMDSESVVHIPQSKDATQKFMTTIDQHGDEGLDKVYSKGNSSLSRLARRDPYFERNRAKICTFFLRGACNRGDLCPYRHEQPKHDQALAKQNIKDRYYGVNDPVARKILARSQMNEPPAPPADQAITTVFLGGVPENTSEDDIRTVFEPYGTIKSLKLLPEKKSALVTFVERADAEAAVIKLYNSCTINDEACRVSWGKRPTTAGPQKPGSDDKGSRPIASYDQHYSQPTGVVPPPPPVWGFIPPPPIAMPPPPPPSRGAEKVQYDSMKAENLHQ